MFRMARICGHIDPAAPGAPHRLMRLASIGGEPSNPAEHSRRTVASQTQARLEVPGAYAAAKKFLAGLKYGS